MLHKDIHAKFDRYFEIIQQIDLHCHFLSSFFLYNQRYLYFSHDQYTSDAVKFHSKWGRRGTMSEIASITSDIVSTL